MVKMNTILTLQIQQWLDYKNTVYEITVKINTIHVFPLQKWLDEINTVYRIMVKWTYYWHFKYNSD